MITLRKIFEKVNLFLPLEQRRFFNYYEDSVNELIIMYGAKFVLNGSDEFLPPDDLDNEIGVYPLYYEAIVDNIVFLSGGEETRKSEFIRKSRDAYLKYWKDNAKGRSIRRMRW